MSNERVLDKLKHRRERIAEKLQTQARILGRELTILADLTWETLFKEVNDLGEIREHGSEIDVLCGKLGILNDVIEELETQDAPDINDLI